MRGVGGERPWTEVEVSSSWSVEVVLLETVGGVSQQISCGKVKVYITSTKLHISFDWPTRQAGIACIIWLAANYLLFDVICYFKQVIRKFTVEAGSAYTK